MLTIGARGRGVGSALTLDHSRRFLKVHYTEPYIG